MHRIISFLLYASFVSVAAAQPANVNPPAGSVWQYYGATLGSGWGPAPPSTGNLLLDASNATSAAFSNLVTAAGSAAVITLGSTPLSYGSVTTNVTGLTLTTTALAGTTTLSGVLVSGARVVSVVDPAISLQRVLNDASGAGNAHGYGDYSIFSRTGGNDAYATGDANPSIAGTTDYNHYLGWQVRAGMDFTGTMLRYAGHDSRLEGGAAGAHIVSAAHFQVLDDASFNGTIDTSYGLAVNELTRATTNWGLWIQNNDAKIGSLIIKKEGRVQPVVGSVGVPSIYFGGDDLTGIYKRTTDTVSFASAGEDRLDVGPAGLIAWNRLGGDFSVDTRGYRSADGHTYGNAILTLAAPNNATAVSQTILNRAFAVLPANTLAANTNFLIGVTAAGNGSLDGAAGPIRTAADMAMMFDSDGTIDLSRLSTTPFARISAIGDSYVSLDADGLREFFMRNVNAGVNARAQISAYNGAAAGDRITIAAVGTGSTVSGDYLLADSGALYAGATLSAGLRLASLNASAGIYFFPGGASQLGAYLTPTPRPSLVVGNAALATTDTDGFLYIASGAGAPTGVPTSFTGRVPLYYDSTNDQLYIYRGGWKQPMTPAGAALVNWQ